MQQYTLLDRPISFSESRKHYFAHSHSTQAKDINNNLIPEKHGDAISLAPVSDPSATFLDYQKSAHENLININKNLSLMLQESFAGIDNICQRVRLCLLDANTSGNIQKYESNQSLVEKLDHATMHEEDTDDDDDSKALEAQVLPEVNLIEEVIPEEEEEIEESEIETKQNEKKGNEDEEDLKPKEKNLNEKRCPSITPFFTILNPRSGSTDSVEIGMKTSTHKKLSRRCISENFQKTMKEIGNLRDYEKYLTKMVDDIDKEIVRCYSEFASVGGKEMDDNKKSGKNKKQDRRKENENKNAGRTDKTPDKKKSEYVFGETELRRYQALKHFSKELMEDQFSENDIASYGSRGSFRRNAICLFPTKIDFTSPDVYRKRAITDLNKRLIAQVEANDSLIFFQKLMAKNKKYIEKSENRPVSADAAVEKSSTDNSNTLRSPMEYLLSPTRHTSEKKQRSLADLSKKYQDSLWFKQRKNDPRRKKTEGSGQKKKRDRKPSKSKSSIRGSDKCLPQSYTVQSSIGFECKPSRARVPKKTPQASTCNCRISVTNDQPLSESAKCKLHWMRAKYNQLSQKKLKHLDILDDITNKDLLPIKSEYPRRDEIKSYNIKDSYLYKLMYGKNMDTQSAWSTLFEPTTKCSQENCEKCSKTLIAERNGENMKDTDESAIKKNDAHCINSRPQSRSERSDVIRKLSKYIFSTDDLTSRKNPKNVFTVMPVHVFYDNARVGTVKKTEVPQKLPLMPMKELKESLRKAEWTDGLKRSKQLKVVFDPAIKRIEQEIRMESARHQHIARNSTGTSRLPHTNSWSPKNFSQYCSSQHSSAPLSRNLSLKNDSLDGMSQKQKKPCIKTAPLPVEIFKKPPKLKSTGKPASCIAPPLWDGPNMHLYNPPKDSSVKRNIEKIVNAEAQSRMKNEQQRKIWENKYGKSVGQRLVNFIEHQPEVYQLPTPKYALPKPAKDASRQQKMLEQLRCLKMKNDNIQTNIQKAIEVIENKMIDILSKPSTSQSIDAFDEMEKEITNVLSLMKTPKNAQQNRLTRDDVTKAVKVDEYTNEVDQISDELFKRLDKILESPVGTSSVASSKKSAKKQENSKRKNRTSSLAKKNVKTGNFSSTSSNDEKFTITAISPKRVIKPTTRDQPIKESPNTIKKSSVLKTPPKNTIKETQQPKTETTPNMSKAHQKTIIKKSSIIGESLELIKEFNTTKQNNRLESPNKEPTPPCKESISIKIPLTNNESNLIQEYAQTMITSYNVHIPETVVNMALLNQDLAGDQVDQISDMIKSIEEEEKTLSLMMELSQGDGDLLGVTKEMEDVSSIDDNAVKSLMEMGDVGGNAGDVGEVEINEVKETPILENFDTAREKPYQTDSLEIQEKPKPLHPRDKTSETSIEVPSTKTTYYTPQVSPSVGLRCQVSEAPKQCCQIDEALKEEEKSSGSEKDSFYDNVNKIIWRVENVYNQLEEFDEVFSDDANIPVFKDDDPFSEVKSDTFLTPFMHALKDLRKNGSESTPESPKTPQRMQKSPSYYNVISFLDSLSDFKEEKAIEVHFARLCNFAYLVHIPITFCQTDLYYLSKFTPPSTTSMSTDIPKTKSGCLKNSSHSSVGSLKTKHQKVSFRLSKEEKATQVTPCPFHDAMRIISQQKLSEDSSFKSLKKDEEISAYLDARENKSVDKMSVGEDDVSTQLSTFESTEETDQLSLEKETQMSTEPAQKQDNVENTEENKEKQKNLVEIFRYSGEDAKEGNLVDGVKVFYDDFNEKEEAIKARLEDLQLITGFYNEASILQVKSSQTKDLTVKKRDSLEKLKNQLFLTEILKEKSLLEPLKHVDNFIDSNLLKQAIEERQKIRMLRRKSSSSLLMVRKGQGDVEGGRNDEARKGGEKEVLIKGFYVFVYLLMFTALNLEYKCV